VTRQFTPDEKRDRERQMRAAGHLKADGSYKRPYHSKQAAKRWLKPNRGWSGTGLTRAKDLEPYRCRFCDLWHIGHKGYQGETR
jgi:hypothetical protein